MADLQELLNSIHVQLAEDLLERIKKGTATSADLSVARQFLKDNNTTSVPAKGTPLGELDDRMSDLPTFDDDDNVIALGG